MIDCYLKSLVNDSIIKCKVDLTRGSEYHIQYTPIVRGQHDLTVTVNGVAGNPFPVFVSVSPTQLGNPVRSSQGWNIQLT